MSIILSLAVIGPALFARLSESQSWITESVNTIADSNNYVFGSTVNNADNPFNASLLFVFWASVGLGIYFIALGLMNASKEINELHAEMNYVHGDRRAIIRDYLERLASRLAGLVLFGGFLFVYLRLLLPVCIGQIRTAEGARVVAATALGLIVLAFIIHALVVALRLTLLRPRLLSNVID